MDIRFSDQDNFRAMPQTTEIDDNSDYNCDREGCHMSWCFMESGDDNCDDIWLRVSGNHRG